MLRLNNVFVDTISIRRKERKHFLIKLALSRKFKRQSGKLPTTPKSIHLSLET